MSWDTHAVVETVQLGIDKIYATWHFAEPPKAGASLAIGTSEMLLMLSQPVACKHIAKIEIQHPRDWREAVKERFAPGWFLRRWPVQYQYHCLEAKALYPKIPLIHNQPVVLTMLKNNQFMYEEDNCSK